MLTSRLVEVQTLGQHRENELPVAFKELLGLHEPIFRDWVLHCKNKLTRMGKPPVPARRNHCRTHSSPRWRRAAIRPTCSSAPGPAASGRVARARGERTI